MGNAHQEVPRVEVSTGQEFMELFLSEIVLLLGLVVAHYKQCLGGNFVFGVQGRTVVMIGAHVIGGKIMVVLKTDVFFWNMKTGSFVKRINVQHVAGHGKKRSKIWA